MFRRASAALLVALALSCAGPGIGEEGESHRAAAAVPSAERPAQDSMLHLMFAEDDDVPATWGEYAARRRDCLVQSQLPNPCPRLYTDSDHRLLLIEACDNDRFLSSGLHIVVAGVRRSYPWFDPPRNRWACSEGCNTAGGCYYEVNLSRSDGATMEVFYHYDINLSYGTYRLRLGPGNAVEVISHTNTDMPS